MKKILVLTAVLVAALAFSSGAFADSLHCSHGTMCGPGVPPDAPGSSTASGSGTLPFTGLDLAGIAVVGGLLLVTGLTLQRVSRRRR